MSWSGAPCVSVLLPVRNGLPYLHEAVQSILAQTCADLELIVVDDGSDDGSGDAARSYDDPRVTVVTTPGLGVAGALNAALAVARGQFIARQDADDRSSVERLAKQVEHFERNPDLTVVTSRVRFVDADGSPARTPWTDAVASQWESATTSDAIARLLPHTCCIVHGSIMARREAMLACGGYDATLAVAQDYDLWLRMLPRARFARLPDSLYTFRLHGTQVSATRNREQARQSVAAKLRYLTINAALPAEPRAHILGTGSGVNLYREAIHQAGWSEVSDAEARDVTIFTDFSTIERDVDAVISRTRHPLMRIGNFLIAGGMRP